MYERYITPLIQHALHIQRELEHTSNNIVKKSIQDIHDILEQQSKITVQDTIQFISYGIVTHPYYMVLFPYSINPISHIIQNIINNIQYTIHDDTYTKVLSDINNISDIDDIDDNNEIERQNIIKEIYGTFINLVNKQISNKHGIVYTPIEIVDFIINSVQYIVKSEFSESMSDIKILDPFTGTGIFITRLISTHLERYNNIQASDIIPLSWYISTSNIQDIIYRKTHQHISPNVNLLDTFNTNNNNSTIILGNPPYSKGQMKYNDQNQNNKYPHLVKRIYDTYLKKSKNVNNTIYDSYIHSIRWASDNITEKGIIAFVTNGSFINSDTTSGLRLSLQQEFTDVYIFNLRGNQRTHGDISRREGGKIFGSGSRTTISILILVKNPNKTTHNIHYKDIGDYLTREQKLDIIKSYKSIENIDWDIISPDKHLDWINQRRDDFDNYHPMGDRDTKLKRYDKAIFRLYSGALKTARDSWMYNSSKKELIKNVKHTISYCNKQDLDNPIIKPKHVAWTSDLAHKIKRDGYPKFNDNNIRISLYKPFFKQYLYFSKTYNQSPSLIHNIFPTKQSKNLLIVIPYKTGGYVSTIITDCIPNLDLLSACQCFPLYRYDNNTRLDNITDYIVYQYRDYYNNDNITKIDIFYYVYGMLHHNGYKQKFENNLQKEMPRIPMTSNFNTFVTAGRKLADLHLNYETCKKYDIQPIAKFGHLKDYKKDTKLAYPKIRQNNKLVQDKTRLKVNGIIAFENLPDVQYKVNGRTPLESMIDRYHIKIDPDNNIVNDPTINMTEQKTIDMVQRLIHVGVESDKIIDEISKESIYTRYHLQNNNLDRFV